MNKLLILLGLLFIYSCGTTSVYQCDDEIGLSKEMCVKQINNIQYTLWKHNTLDGYKEIGLR